MKTYLLSDTTWYHHGSSRNKYGSKPGDRSTWFVAGVDSFTPAAELRENGWALLLPSGSSTGAYDSAEEAIAAADDILVTDGWTTDKGLAERRAQKEAELRASGRMRHGGPTYGKGEDLKLANTRFEACKKEVMEVK